MDNNKCSGCSAVIYDILFMECSEGRCKKLYHLKCLNITKEKFEDFTQEYKVNWVCPECVRAMPKMDNTDTPVRGNPVLNKTFTPISHVNVNRGSHNEDLSIIMDTESKVLKELQEFRSETKMHMDEQAKKYELLHNQFKKMETELWEIRKKMTVDRENDKKVKILQTELKLLREKNEQLESKLSAKITTGKDKVVAKSYASMVVPTLQKNIKEVCGATKPETIQKEQIANKVNISQNIITEVGGEEGEKLATMELSLAGDKKVQKSEGDWTVMNRKKKRYPTTGVKKGGLGDATGIEIQGTERKKYLHVWRLRKETTVEQMENYIKKIFNDNNVSLKIDRINHKTERDYASFIVGVPESIIMKNCLTLKIGPLT